MESGGSWTHHPSWLPTCSTSKSRPAPAFDACAAPGGRPFAGIAGHPVHAVDLEPHRLAMVGEVAACTSPTASPPRFTTGCRAPWLRTPGSPACSLTRRAPPWASYAATRNSLASPGVRSARHHPATNDPGACGRVAAMMVCSSTRSARPCPKRARSRRELDGFRIRFWSSAPPAGDEDAFQAFVLGAEGLHTFAPHQGFASDRTDTCSC